MTPARTAVWSSRDGRALRASLGSPLFCTSQESRSRRRFAFELWTSLPERCNWHVLFDISDR